MACNHTAGWEWCELGGVQHVQRQVRERAWEQVEYWSVGAGAEGERQPEPGGAVATLH